MAQDADILIVGGGLNGPCLAIALAKSGLSSIVVDALPEDTRMGRNSTGGPTRWRLPRSACWARWACGTDLEDNAQPMLEIKASDGRAGEGAAPQFLHFDHAEIEEGPMGHMLEDRHLRRALLDAMASRSR
jgi:2-octaprenyl-6-methoxyphenol hydroxylase